MSRGHSGAGRHGQLACPRPHRDPVIFYWLREREIGTVGAQPARDTDVIQGTKACLGLNEVTGSQTKEDLSMSD